MTVSKAAFGAAGFGSVDIVSQHNSPGKINIDNPEPCVPSGATHRRGRLRVGGSEQQRHPGAG